MVLELLLLINSSRITPLSLDRELSNIATQRAEIVYNTEWSHKNWEDSFGGNIKCSYMGENLAKGFNTPEEIHNALMTSPTHKKNIVNEKYDIIGIGEYKGTVVELFCKKLNFINIIYQQTYRYIVDTENYFKMCTVTNYGL